MNVYEIDVYFFFKLYKFNQHFVSHPAGISQNSDFVSRIWLNLYNEMSKFLHIVKV